MKIKPILSIGMIYKNEIRCLERCLKALQPLRDALPCELVMADTGSEDGSRAVAERYADIHFDFSWVNDFAVARNAVMDRCSGQWYFSIDADEWLDGDIKELVSFFQDGNCERFDACALTERNYYTYDLNGGYGAFMPWRLLRMSTGLRYRGAIHESWNLTDLRLLVLRRTLLHHDGYVAMNGPSGKGKRDRNMKLLREKLEKNPNDLLARLQFIESGSQESDFLDNLCRAVTLVEERAPCWDTLGASVFRYAIGNARVRKMPEIEKWLQEAEEWFPKSYFIRMDAAFNAAAYFLEKEEYASCIYWGEKGLSAYADYREGKGEIGCQLYGSLQNSTPLCEASLKVVLSRGYFESEQVEKGAELLAGIDYTVLDAQWTKNLLETLQMFHHRSELDTAPLLSAFWEGINKPEPAADWAERRRTMFVQTAGAAFVPSFIRREEGSAGFLRHVYTMYGTLAGRCSLGEAALALAAEEPEEMARYLGAVEKWEEMPIQVLSRALRKGMMFPLPDRTLNLEEMDSLAARLALNWTELYEILNDIAQEDYTGSWQSLTWTRALALAAVQNFDWKTADSGMNLARTFARVEEAFITGCYAPEVLREGNLCVLPAMHRFGWYCAQAFSYLEAGDTLHYVRLLREALTSYEGAKHMVDFLLENTPELQAPPESPAPELLELAEKVRALLAQYDPADPAVAVLKASPAYQKVAHVIESA